MIGDAPQDDAAPDQPDAPPPDQPHRHGLLDPFLSDEGLLSGLAEQEEQNPRPRSGADQWAHRRGEPRIFALFLSMYLLGGAMLTIFAAPTLGNPSAATFLHAARTLLVLVAIGVVAIWPMTRLSQASPRKPALAGLADAIVVTMLAQAVIWPATVLPGGANIWPAPWLGLWPWSVAAGIATLFASWSLLMGSFIACGVRRSGDGRRAMWMVFCLLIGAGAPTYALIAGRLGISTHAALMLCSPITAAIEFIEAPSGLSARMESIEWLAALAPAPASGLFWTFAARGPSKAASTA